MENKKNIFIPQSINIPLALFEDERLSPMDKYLYFFIEGLDNERGCYASNGYLATMMNSSSVTISQSISNLKKCGYVLQKSFDGRSRVLNADREYTAKQQKKAVDNYSKRYNENLANDIVSLNQTLNHIKIDNKTSFSSYNSSKEELTKKSEEGFSNENLMPPPKIKTRTKPLTETESEKPLSNLMKALNVILPSELHPQQPKKPITPLQVPSDVQEIFDYWTELQLHLPRTETKSHNECIRKVKGLLNGRLFGKKYTIEEIKTSIINFSIAALDPNFEPSDAGYKKNLSKKNIDEFIYNSFLQKGNNSLFKVYLERSPEPATSKQIVKTEYPKVVNKLKDFYIKEVIGGAEVQITDKDENSFRIAANRLMEFWDKNHSRFNSHMSINPPLMAGWLCEAIQADCNGDVSKITPGWFCSDTTFNRRYPAYLYRQAILEEKESRGINMYDYNKKPLSEEEKRKQAVERGDVVLDY